MLAQDDSCVADLAKVKCLSFAAFCSLEDVIFGHESTRREFAAQCCELLDLGAGVRF